MTMVKHHVQYLSLNESPEFQWMLCLNICLIYTASKFHRLIAILRHLQIKDV